MKLILEDIEDVKYITEKREDGKKNLYIEGIFMQGGIKISHIFHTHNL